jgi:hypothetical protein
MHSHVHAHALLHARTFARTLARTLARTYAPARLLPPPTHTFRPRPPTPPNPQVRSDGVSDITPLVYQWVVDVSPPVLRLLAGPPALSAAPAGSAQFTFGASEAGVVLEYQFGEVGDGGAGVPAYSAWLTAPSMVVDIAGLNTTATYRLRVRTRHFRSAHTPPSHGLVSAHADASACGRACASATVRRVCVGIH